MDFSLSKEQESLVAAVAGICGRFGDDYWLERDREGGLPREFVAALAQNGWLGICIPEEYGGSGLGILDAGLMMRAIAESGAGMSGASAIHMNIFGLNPVVVFGNDEQKRRMLPPLARGEERSCFAVTEPDTGLNTTRLKTRGATATVTSSMARKCGFPPYSRRTRCCCWREPRRSTRCASRHTD